MTTSSDRSVSNLVHDIRQKQPLRDRLDAEVEEFKRNGGQVQTLTPGDGADRCIDDEGED